MLLDFLKPTDPAVTVHGSSAQVLSRCVFSDRDEELVFSVKDSLRIDGLDVLSFLGLRKCLNHRLVIG